MNAVKIDGKGAAEKYWVHCKNTWVTSTTILGCPSCISVTKECYQIGFLESSLRSFFFSYIS